MKSLKVQKNLLPFLSMFVFVAVVLLQLGYAGITRAEGESGEVTITSPDDGAAIKGSSVDVVFELRDKVTRGNHVHLYLDGKLVKPLHGRKVSYTINGVSSGKHTITIKLATKSHQVLDVTDSVSVDVR